MLYLLKLLDPLLVHFSLLKDLDSPLLVGLRHLYLVKLSVKLQLLLDLLALSVKHGSLLVPGLLMLSDGLLSLLYACLEHLIYLLAGTDMALKNLLFMPLYARLVLLAPLLVESIHSFNIIVSASQVHVLVLLVFFSAHLYDICELRVSLGNLCLLKQALLFFLHPF